VLWAQLAQVNAPLIAPANGSEHFAQNGGTMRVIFASHSGQRYSLAATLAEQIVQVGG
jgi:hypothetical protein